ncbi:hypothetical protein PAECIP111893_01866 [Paenibacillus plantiphilus]|uniref:Uncharacterized protein n=1 Tax=Paenibacillus plantiphilus TaxID=2905650 RepID=A0ABM9C5I7_9BACL|nr:hypothetical protein PAECIP111893_01866 [Paenibacillus plantiphilus]
MGYLQVGNGASAPIHLASGPSICKSTGTKPNHAPVRVDSCKSTVVFYQDFSKSVFFCSVGTVSSVYYSAVSRKYRVKAINGSAKGCCKQEKSCYSFKKTTPITLPATLKRKNLLTEHKSKFSPSLSRKKRLNDGMHRRQLRSCSLALYGGGRLNGYSHPSNQQSSQKL